MPRFRFFASLLPVPALALLVGAAPADFEGRGESAIIGGNLVSARARALGAARLDCLTRAVATELGVERAAREAMRLAPVLVRAERFVRSYRVLEEGEQGPRFVVRLACDVQTAKLRRAVENALGTTLGGASGAAWQVQLQVQSVPEQKYSARLLQRARLDLERGGLKLAASTLPGTSGEPGGASIEIAVRSSKEPPIRGLGWPARRVLVELSVGSSGLVATAEAYGFVAPSGDGTAVAAERALDKAVGDALPLLRSAGGTSVARFELRADGLRNVADLLELERALDEAGAAPGLLTIEGRSAAFAVQVAGGAPTLASSLHAHGWPNGQTLSRQRISGGTLWLTFSAR